jgi:serpin B
MFATATETMSGYSNRSCALEIVNSLWAQQGDNTLLPEFVEILARCYRGELCVTDFGRAIEAVASINGWVAGKTRHKIREVMSPRQVNDRTRMVIVNAMFFKGTWQFPFEANATRNEPFFAEGDQEVLAPLMRQHVRIGHVQADGYQAIDLPYKGDDLSMLILLPDRKTHRAPTLRRGAE